MAGGWYQARIASLDRGDGITHDQVKDWVASWGSANEKPAPKKS